MNTQKTSLKKYPKWVLLLSLCVGLSVCAGVYQVIKDSDSNGMVYAPVVVMEYNYEGILGGNVNGGCIPRTSNVGLEKVGQKRSGDGGECGGFPLPKKWYPGMTLTVNWKINPYPRWMPRLGVDGEMFNDDDYNTIVSYNEYHSARIPVPPYDKVSEVAVHFLACNQIFIDFGTLEDLDAKERDFALFDESAKLCKPRPVVKSMEDYKKKKEEMDQARKDREHIPQVILPNYIKRLEAEGKMPKK